MERRFEFVRSRRGVRTTPWIRIVLLAALWLLVVGWQVQEHLRVKDSAKTELRDKSKEIANTLCALIRGIRFRGGIPKDRLESALNAG